MRIKRIVICLLVVLFMTTIASASYTIEDLYLRAHDLQPYYYAKIVDTSQNPINLTGATVVFTMKTRTGTVAINRQAAIVTDGPNGLCEYRWQSGDTDTDGTYYIEFEITPSSGGKFTVPDRYTKAKVIIEKDLDSQ